MHPNEDRIVALVRQIDDIRAASTLFPEEKERRIADITKMIRMLQGGQPRHLTGVAHIVLPRLTAIVH